MKPISVPLSSITPTLTIVHNEDGDSRGSSRILASEELGTEWLRPFLEETALLGVGPDELRIRVTLRKERGLVRGMAEVAMRPQLECARSLTIFRETIEVRQEAFFTEEDDALRSHGEHEISEEEFSAYPIEDNRILLDAFLLDVLSTALPLNPLCRPDCKGLCTACGESLNERNRCARAEQGSRAAAGKESAPCPNFP